MAGNSAVVRAGLQARSDDDAHLGARQPVDLAAFEAALPQPARPPHESRHPILMRLLNGEFATYRSLCEEHGIRLIDYCDAQLNVRPCCSAMIAQVWHGWTTGDNADAYQRLLEDVVFPGIAQRGMAGYLGIDLLRRDAGNELEFVTIMWFRSMADVHIFAGDDVEAAYVPPAARTFTRPVRPALPAFRGPGAAHRGLIGGLHECVTVAGDCVGHRLTYPDL